MFFFNQAFFKYVAGLLIGLAVMGSATTASALHSRKIGVVNVDSLNFRAGPGLSHDVLRVLSRDTRVRVLERKDSWLQVMHDGDIGYVYDSKRYLKRYVIHTVRDGDDAELDLARAKARRIQQKIQNKSEKVARLDQKAQSIADELDALDRQLVEIRQKRDDIEAAMAKTEKKIKRTRHMIEETESAIAEQSAYATERLAALYKLNRLGEMNLLATADSMYEVFRRKVAIETVVGHDEKVIGRMRDKKRRLANLARRLKSKKQQKRHLEQQFRQTRAALEKKKQARRKVLAAVETQKSDRLAKIEYLRQAAGRMEKTISTLKKSGPDTRKAFSEYQGLLKMPVTGKIVSDYGKYTDPQSRVVHFRNGIEIRADRGAPVRAVFEGKTIFCDWLKGYGRVLIIDHGGNYYTVYAHVEDLFSRKGDRVEAGEVIATVGDTGSLGGPALYFEVRHHGEPTDPLAWLDNG
ncbi:MAG: peptidoglycan DD-metalloendopeptidase family protein [Thermodesulfobacteriota bacterium]